MPKSDEAKIEEGALKGMGKEGEKPGIPEKKTSQLVTSPPEEKIEEERIKEDEMEEEAPPKKGSNLKWIIIGVVVLLVLGGGGFIGWKTFLNPATGDVKEEGTMRVEMGPTFPLDAFIVNLAGTSGERYLKVTMELELKEGGLVSELEKRKPQVRDTVLLLLSSKTFEDIATFGGKTKLRNEVTARLNGILAPGSIKKIYFTEFVVQ